MSWVFYPSPWYFKSIVYIERVLREFVVLINGRYDNTLVTFALFVSAIGFLGVLGRQLKNGNAFLLYYLEKLIQRIPLIGSIYRVTQKLLQLFVKTDESQLTEVVYVEYPKDGMWVPAYVTNKIGDCYVLYIPTSPYPTSGFTVVVHKSKIRQSAMSIEEVSSFVISVGVDIAKPDDMECLYR